MGLSKTTALAILAASVSFQANASIQEVVGNFQSSAEVSGITMNKDGSVSIQDITVKRGDRTYYVTDESYLNACRMLGFDSVLEGHGLNKYGTISGPKVSLNSEGKLESIKNYNYKISKVTCYNEGELKDAVAYESNQNEDGSYTITDIKYLLGDRAFKLGAPGAESEYAANACKLLGFEGYLEGGSAYATASGIKAMIGQDGAFTETKSYNYSVAKVTCYSGSEPDLLIYVGGNKYVRVSSNSSL